MPTLNWIGKDKVQKHPDEVPYRVLNHQYTYPTNGNQESVNKIIHGDNLEALKALLPEYEGKVDCIYIDPPYNTGNEGWVYNDNVNDPHIRKWLNQTVGKEAEDLTRHDKWLCMMYPRLVLLQRLLAPTGVIFISIDDNEQANLKLICDEIFGAGNLLLSMVVNRSSEIATAYTIQKHEYCLCYTRNIDRISIIGNERYTISRGTVGNKEQTMPKITFPKGLKCYGIADGVYKPRQVEGSNENIESYTPIVVKDEILQNDIVLKARWRSSNDMRNFFANNCQRTKAKINGYIEEIYFNSDKFNPQIKKLTTAKLTSLYLDNKKGSDALKLMNIDNFDYPKYIGFIEYLINLFTASNALILDSFAGSGTTAHAVLNLNKRDGGHRRFILVEMCDYAETITAERVRRVIDGYGEGNKAVEGTGGSFSYYELGETIYDPQSGLLNDNADIEHIRRYIWYSETTTPYQLPTTAQHPYLLGQKDNTRYYFYYRRGKETALDRTFLSTFTLADKAEQYIIYADCCRLSKDFLLAHHITFKQIPRDIKKV